MCAKFISQVNWIVRWDNDILLRWIPAHKGHTGNEKQTLWLKVRCRKFWLHLSATSIIQNQVEGSIARKNAPDNERPLEKTPTIPLQAGVEKKFARPISKISKSSGQPHSFS